MREFRYFIFTTIRCPTCSWKHGQQLTWHDPCLGMVRLVSDSGFCVSTCQAVFRKIPWILKATIGKWEYWGILFSQYVARSMSCHWRRKYWKCRCNPRDAILVSNCAHLGCLFWSDLFLILASVSRLVRPSFAKNDTCALILWIDLPPLPGHMVHVFCRKLNMRELVDLIWPVARFVSNWMRMNMLIWFDP